MDIETKIKTILATLPDWKTAEFPTSMANRPDLMQRQCKLVQEMAVRAAVEELVR